MSLVTREMAVIYDTLTIGGGSADVQLVGPVRRVEAAGSCTAQFGCTAVIRPATQTDAGFLAAVEAVMVLLRTPHKRLRWVVGSTTLRDWDPAASTGFNIIPDIEKAGEMASDSSRAMLVRCTWAIDLPADTYAASGRRDSRVETRHDAAGRRVVSITGEYRSLSGVSTSGLAVYNAAIETFVTSILGALPAQSGLGWNITAEETDLDDRDHICTFSREYTEQLFPQTAGANLDDDLVDPSLEIALDYQWPGDSPGVRVDRMQTASVRYRTAVDKRETTDLAGKWLGTIRPHLIASVRSYTRAAELAVLAEQPVYDVTGNWIGANLRVALFGGGAGILEFDEQVLVHETPGYARIPVWTGQRWDRYIYPTYAERTRSTTRRWRRRGLVRSVGVRGATALPVGGLSEEGRAGDGAVEASLYVQPRTPTLTPNVEQWLRVDESVTFHPTTLGDLSTGGGVVVTDIVWTMIEEWVKPLLLPSPLGLRAVGARRGVGNAGSGSRRGSR